MKILMISRATLFTAPGGDTIQIMETASHLRELGVQVDIKLTNEEIAYSDYDIVHFFNIIRPADILSHTQYLTGIYVISPIFVDYGEYEKNVRTGLIKYVNQLFSSDTIEYLKVIARAVLNGERIRNKTYIFKGHRRSVKYLIRSCAILLPNSDSEYKRLLKKYNTENAYQVIPNAVSLEKFATLNTYPREGVLCVARFEPLKNQLNLIKAINKTNLKLTLIGRASPNSEAFFQACKQEARHNPNILFIEHLSQSDLKVYYEKAKVHVLPSWFETTGLSTLEAAACGCNIVVTDKGDTKEYFGDYAYFCRPESEQSILEAVLKANAKENNFEMRDKILRSYNWGVTAQRTFEAYKKALKINEN